MNALMTITVRVVNGATPQIAAIQQQLASLGLQITKVNSSGFFDSFAASAQRFSDVMNRVANRMITTFTVPILGALDEIGKAALAQETAAAQLDRVYGTLGETTAQTAGDLSLLNTAFTDLSDKFGIAKTDVVNIATAWAQAGASGIGLAKDVQTSLEVMTLGLADATDASKDLIAIQSEWQLSNQATEQTVQDLVVTTKLAPVSFSDMAQGIINAGGAARTAGVNIDQLIALLTTMAPATGSAANAGDSLRTILTRMLVPTKDAVQVLGMMGINMLSANFQMQDGAQKLQTLAAAFVKLTPAQQGVVSQVVASRFQISQFDTALRDIADPAGKYATILGDLSNKQSVYNEYSKELTTILTSQPQGFKELWQTLQNLLVQVVAPLLPALLALGGEVVSLVTWFSQLNPVVQQLVLYGALLLAVAGPLFKVLSSISGLLSIMIKFGGFLIDSGGAIFSALGWVWDLGAVAWAAITDGIESVIGALAAAGGLLSGFLEGLVEVITIVGGAVLELVAGWEIELVAAVAAAIVAALVLIFVNFDTVKQWVSDFGNWLVSTMRDAWNLLPDIVQQAMQDVIQVLANAAESVVHFLSYLNPFARHSPSLVDNVQAGTSVVADQYNGLASGPLQNVQQQHAAFVQAAAVPDTSTIAPQLSQSFTDANTDSTLDTTGLSVKQLKTDVADLTSQMDTLKSSLDTVTSSLDAANSVLKGLQDNATATKTALDDATTTLNDLKNTQVSGSQAMSNAIFDNTQKQNALNLAIDKLSDVGGTYEDVAQQASLLNGQIEQLTAKQTTLRAEGAGSDVLAPYNSQLKSLQDQQAGLVNIGSQYTDLTNQLAAVQHAGDELNLTQSIQFDPLNRQLQQVTSNFKELPFDQLLSQTTAAQQQVNSLTTAYETQSDAVEAQQSVVSVLQAQHDGLASTYANEKSQLDQLNAAIQTANSTATAKLGQAATDFQAGSAANFAVPSSPQVPANDTGNLDQYVKSLTDSLKGQFKFGDIFKPITDLAKKAFDPLKSAWDDAWAWVAGPGLGSMQHALSGAFGGGGGVFKSIGDAFSSAVGGMASVGNSVFSSLSRAAGGFWSVVGPIFSNIGQIINNSITPTLRSMGNEFLKLWNVTAGPALSALWHGILEPALSWFVNFVKANFIPVVTTIGIIFGTVFGAIATVVSAVFTNVVMPILSGVWWFLSNAAIPILQLLLGIAQIVFAGIAAAIAAMWFTFVKPVFDALIWTIQNVIGPVMSWLWHNVVTPIFQGISGAIKLAWQGIQIQLQAFHDFITLVLAPVFNWLWKNIIDPAFSGISAAMSKVWDTIMSDARTAINFLIEAFNDIAGIIETIGSAVGVTIKIDAIKPLTASGGTSGGVKLSAAGDIYRGVGSSNVGSGFKTNSPRAIVGEGNALHNEYVIPTDPQHRTRALGLASGLMGELGIPGFANGGILGGIGSLVSKIPGLGDLASTVGGWLNKGADAGIDAAKGAADSVINGLVPLKDLKDIGTGAVDKSFNGLKAIVASAFGRQSAVGSSSGPLGGQGYNTLTSWLGVPYLWGGGHNVSEAVARARGVDCSGLVDEVYGQTGNTGTQIKIGASIPNLAASLPGDLVFFGTSLAAGEPHHVGIITAAGGSQMIDAPHTGTVVRYDNPNAFGSIDGIRRWAGEGAGAVGPGLGGTIGGGSAAANMTLGRSMADAYGWAGTEWDAFNKVATRESGWNQFARNASSGAYGIPQALPESKLPFTGQAAGGSSPAAQIAWMLQYVGGRYGDPAAAWAHERGYGWYADGGILNGLRSYDSGGALSPGLTLAYNRTGKTETVLTAEQAGAFKGGESKTFNFYGNLEFPNVTTGDDADTFVKNLERLI